MGVNLKMMQRVRWGGRGILSTEPRQEKGDKSFGRLLWKETVSVDFDGLRGA